MSSIRTTEQELIHDDVVDNDAPNTALMYIPATPGAIVANIYNDKYGIIWSRAL